MKHIQQKYKLKRKKPYLFIGSKVRGSFGYALKDEVCINPSFECEGCFAAKECIFYQMFMVQNTTHDYRLDFELFDKEFRFSLLLFNQLQESASSIQKAMLKSLQAHKIKVKTKEKKLKTKKPKKRFKVILKTPLRIKKNNRYLTRNIQLLDILISIQKRAIALGILDKRVIFDTNYKEMQNIYFQEIIRKSNKQNRRMNFGGLMGEIIVEESSKEVYRMLKIGEIVGVGKQTTFGLGKITVEAFNE